MAKKVKGSKQNAYAPYHCKGSARSMYILVMFDLPVGTQKERREATRFRHALLADGYIMIQFSVYARFVPAHDRVETHLKRLEIATPPSGSIRAITVTELQYMKMKHLMGKPKKQEGIMNQQLVLF
jgi:CRISPR-associated protein Cas2